MPPYDMPQDPAAEHRPPPPPMHAAPQPWPLGPVGLVAQVIGLFIGLSAPFTPAVAWAQLGVLGASAFVLSVVAGSREGKTPIFGVLGGIFAVAMSMVGYSEWAKAVESLDQLGL